MEKLGTVRFFASHSQPARTVAFSPVERYLFASGGNDGNICLYHACRTEILNVYNVIAGPSPGMNRHINGIRFTVDGKKILAVTASRRLAILDTERGSSIASYDNCSYSVSGRERCAIAADPTSPNVAVCSYVNGKGIALFDLRMPLPLDFLFDFHTDPIRDIQFLHESWPFVTKFGSGSQHSILSISSQGMAKVTSFDGRLLHTFDFQHATNSIVATPEPFGSGMADGFQSSLVAGGTVISSYALQPRSPSTSTLTSYNNSCSSLINPSGSSSCISVTTPIDYIESSSTSNVPQRTFQVIRSTSANNLTNSIDANVNLTTSSPYASGGRASSSSGGSYSSSNAANARRWAREVIFSLDAASRTMRISQLPVSVARNGSNSGNSSNLAVGSNSSTEASPSVANSIRQQIIQAAAASTGRYAPMASNSGNGDQFITIASPSVINHSGSNTTNVIAGASYNSPLLANSHLHQLLAMNFMPIQRGNANGNMNLNVTNTSSSNHHNHNHQYQHQQRNRAGILATSAAVSTISTSQVQFHDRWDRNSWLPIPTNTVTGLISSTPSSSFDGAEAIGAFSAPSSPSTGSNTSSSSFASGSGSASSTPPNSAGGVSLSVVAAPTVQPRQIWRLRYSSNGAILYAAGDGGAVKRYRQNPGQTLKCIGELYRHQSDVYDLDISPYDEYLVTASKDNTVGLLCLGPPNHGWTEYYELT